MMPMSVCPGRGRCAPRVCSIALRLVLAIACVTGAAHAQTPDFVLQAYPPRTTDPAAVARGRALYIEYGCSFCHGEDTRGAAGGPSLLRSGLVQRDQRGETIADVVRNGVPNTTMVGFPLSGEQVADIAEFLHSFELSSRDPARVRPESIVTGNARAGRRYFDTRCGDCHSATADLRGIASRFPDPRALQQHWLMPRSAPPVTVQVTTRDGARVAGELRRIDEFIVSLELEDGSPRTFKRVGDEPVVEIHDPLARHKSLLPEYSDSDIHNVTAYLVTLVD